MRLRVAAPIAALCALLAASAVRAQAKPLWVLDVSVVGEVPLDVGRALRVRLYSNSPKQLAALLPGVVAVAADHIVLEPERAPVLGRGEPAPPVPTFVVDYETEPVAKLVGSLVERFGPRPSDEQLKTFVREGVDSGYGHGFDIASQVATHREGDCTEHAVLLAALARAVGLPARIAFGSVIVHTQGRVGAYGHAWTEVYRDGRWSLVDSALLEGDVPLSYVPEGLLEDEGPGYLFGFMSSLASGILRVEVLGNAVEAGS